MNQERKQTIINEIVYWRENKLLPEAYCNFLLTLYTEGEGLQQSTNTVRRQKKSNLILLIIGLFLPVLLLVTYFTEISPNLQMVLNLIFLIICFFLVLFNRTISFILHLGSIITALLLLVLSVNASEIYFGGKTGYLIAVIICNCVGWICIGIFSKKKYFLFAGIIGMLAPIILFV
ncbi:hypothetical protein ACLM5H_02275 [Fredinandcohnia humi]